MLLEESMKKIHYESYEQWVNNFAINLDRIWEESSAKELPESKPNSSAIVIGRGPSIRKFQHLELAHHRYPQRLVSPNQRSADCQPRAFLNNMQHL